MNIIYHSFHTIDIDGAVCTKQDVPASFQVFLEDYIDFAKKNEKNKEYVVVSEQNVVEKNIVDLVLNKNREQCSHSIAKHLLECEQVAQGKIFHMGTNVKKGSLLQALIEVKEDEYQYVLAKVEHTSWFDGSTLSMNYGFPTDKNSIWKSAVFTLYKINDSILFQDVKVYMDTKSKYWTISFLQLEEKRDDFSNTSAAFRAIDSELKSSIKEKSPRDYALLSDDLQKTMNQYKPFEYNEYIDEWMDSYEPVNKEIEKDVLKECLKALPERKKFDTEFKTVPQSIANKRTKKYGIANGVELTIHSDATDFTSRIHSTIQDGKRVLIVQCDDEDTYASFIEE